MHQPGQQLPQSAAGQKRGTLFQNVSKEEVPPFGCMMLVADPARMGRKWTYGPLEQVPKSSTRFFSVPYEGEYKVFVDVPDFAGSFFQEHGRFMFNGPTSVPPGGHGRGFYQDYPCRCSMQSYDFEPGFHDGGLYVQQGSFQLWPGFGKGAAFKSAGHISDGDIKPGPGNPSGSGAVNEGYAMCVPTSPILRPLAVWGKFKTSGTENVPLYIDGWTAEGGSYTHLPVGQALEQFFGRVGKGSQLHLIPEYSVAPFAYYAFYFSGLATIKPTPKPEVKTAPFTVAPGSDPSYQLTRDIIPTDYVVAEGVLQKLAVDPYSTIWNEKYFNGVRTFLSNKKGIQIKMGAIGPDVNTEGNWICYAHPYTLFANELWPSVLDFPERAFDYNVVGFDFGRLFDRSPGYGL